MDKKTLKALQASIEKWQGYTTTKEWPSLGHYTCPLCMLFYEDNCNGCPVSDAALTTCCDNTPYATVVLEARFLPAFHEAAKAELAFLQSLLPKDQENA